MHPASNGQPADKGTKRTRLVYPVNEVPHLWANGVADPIRSTSSSVRPAPGGTLLVSYATAVGNRLDAFTPEGSRVFLLTSKEYSKTTSTLVGRAESAIPFRFRWSFADAVQSVPGLLMGEWSGHLADLPASGQTFEGVPLDRASVVFKVPHVGRLSEGGTPTEAEHLENLRHLVRTAVEAVEKAGRRLSAEADRSALAVAFADARLYCRTFVGRDFADFIPASEFDRFAVILSKVRTRVEKHRKAVEADAAAFRRSEAEWIAKAAPLLRFLAEAAREERTRTQNPTLALDVAEFENGGKVEAFASVARPGLMTIARAADALIRTGCDASPTKSDDPFRVCVRAIRPGFGGFYYVPAYPTSPVRHVFGKPVRDYDRDLSKVWDAVGINPREFNAHGLDRFGRDLIQVDASGNIRTSKDARVPLSIVRALWGRHSAEVREAALAPYALRFPEVRKAGHYVWTGYEVASPAAVESSAGASCLRVGCHLIGAADVIRLAARLKWPDA